MTVKNEKFFKPSLKPPINAGPLALTCFTYTTSV